MKKLLLLFFAVLSFIFSSYAITPPDEGMWLPMFVERLNYVDMQKMGLHLTPDELYSVNHSSLKDAVVGLSSRGGAPNSFFCTSVVVSDQGLIFTNHHCGFNSVQLHSTPEHDYLTNGFWAKNKAEELSNKDMTASFLVRMENVTSKILPELSDTMTESERSAKITEISSKLKKQASEDDKYDVTVKSFYGGNEFYLFVYETYKDVRLVGAPPSSIGKFGGDTDNWMWPRHTGDFTVFRIYTAPDGSPAKYSKDNIPLKPKYHLPISLNGVKKNDFAMIWGFPGRTERYATSYAVKFNIDQKNPMLIKIFGKKLNIWKKDMDADHNVKLKYASKYAMIANSWKYFIGQTRGLKRLKVYDEKLSIEDEFTKWVNSDEERKKEYGKALQDIKDGYEGMDKVVKPLYYLSLAGIRGADIINFASRFKQFHNTLKSKAKNEDVIKQTADELRDVVKKHFKDYNMPTDKKIFAALLEMYYKNVSIDQQPSILAKINKKYKGNFDKYAERVFDKSIFANEDKINKFLTKPKYKTLDKDPAYKFMSSMFENYMKYVLAYKKNITEINKGNRLFIEGLHEMNPDKIYYPDANSTMRLTYGKVLDYYPADAVHYYFETTLKGVMEKEDPENDEFIVPARLKQLYKKKDYGPYGQDGKMIVCFITNNDITGGNSGSPVINGDGQLIGLAFDGNWEAMSGDIAYEPRLQRTINVDIRYVLFIIDKYAGATNIIDELDLVKKNTVESKAEVEKTNLVPVSN